MIKKEHILVPIDELEYKSHNCLKYMVDNLVDENMLLRQDCTILKLTLNIIIEDLENVDGNEKYVEWIKENCNLQLYSSINLVDLKEDILRKRSMKYRHQQMIMRDALDNASHPIEYTTILKLSKELGIDMG